MIVLSNLLLAVAQILGTITTILIYLFIARAVLSWFSPDPYNPIVRFLHSCTDPVLDKIRRTIPTQVGMLDLSVFIVILILVLIQSVVIKSIADYAVRLMLHR